MKIGEKQPQWVVPLATKLKIVNLPHITRISGDLMHSEHQ